MKEELLLKEFKYLHFQIFGFLPLGNELAQQYIHVHRCYDIQGSIEDFRMIEALVKRNAPLIPIEFFCRITGKTVILSQKVKCICYLAECHSSYAHFFYASKKIKYPLMKLTFISFKAFFQLFHGALTYVFIRRT